MSTNFDNWMVFALYHPELCSGTCSGEGGQGATASRRGFIGSYISAIEETGYLPNSAKLAESEPHVFRVVGKNPGSGALLGIMEYQGSKPSKDIWRLEFKGSIGPCLMFYIDTEDTVAIHGVEIDVNARHKTIGIAPSDDLQKFYCFSHRKKRFPTVLYPSKNVVSTMRPLFNSRDEDDQEALFQLPNSVSNTETHTLVISYPKKTINAAQTSFDAIEVNREELRSSPARSSVRRGEPSEVPRLRKRGNPSPSPRRGRGSDDIPFVRRERPEVRTPESTRPNINMEGFDYNTWIDAGWFIPGESRPKVKKAKCGSKYTYTTLAELDNELRSNIAQQHRRGNKPTMILPEQRFAYGVVVDVLPPRQVVMNSFVVRITDESKENVLLRICTSDMEPRKGPPIKVGQIIRVHRVTVQVEHDNVLDKNVMVLSTAPHWNYTLFDLQEDMSRVLIDTLAKDITLTSSDMSRVRTLFKFARESELFRISYAGEATTVNPGISDDTLRRYNIDMQEVEELCAIAVQAEDDIEDNDSGESHNVDNPQPASPSIPAPPAGYVRRPTRGRHYSPTFHVPAPGYPV